MPSLPAIFVELKATTSQFMASFDQAKKTVNDFSSQSTSGMQKLEQVGKVAFIGLASAATAFGAIAVKAALEGEAAHAQLTTAVENTGAAFSSVSPAVDDMSTRFARLGYENDQVEAALARLVQSTGNVSGSMKEMGLVADFARARHIDLEQAATLVGKVMNGNVAALQRVGISTKDAAGNTLTAAQALQMLGDRFSGAAQAQANTYAGKLQALNAEWKNMTEQVGNALLPVLSNMAGAVADTVGWFGRHHDAVVALATVIGGPLVIAMSAYIAKQTVAFVGSTVDTVKKIGTAIMSILVPATETEAAALTTAATAEAILTAGLSVAAGVAAMAAAGFITHASATEAAATGAGNATDAVAGLGDAEGDLGDTTDATTNALKAQSNLFKQLNDDANAQQSEVLKLIGDQNSLDAATERLTSSTGANSEVTKQAAQHTKDLAEAKQAEKDAEDKVTEALDRQTAAKKKLDDLMKPQTQKNIIRAQDDFQAAQDRVTKTSADLTDKQKALTDAVAKHGPTSKEAKEAQLDYNQALRDAHAATADLDDAQQALANTYRPTIGTTDELKTATDDLGRANSDVTKAQDAQKTAQLKLNDVLANRDAVTAAKTDAKNMADNTLAWQQATLSLNGDWATLQGTMASHPELLPAVVGQLKQMKDNAPKGADLKPLQDLIDKINGIDLAKTQAANLFVLATSGNIKFKAGDPQKILDILGGDSASAVPAGPGGQVPMTSFMPFGPGHAGGGPVSPGVLYPIGERGPEWFAPSVPGVVLPNGGSGVITIGNVTIQISGAGLDEEAVANRVRDKLIQLGRNNVNVGLS